jgi:hypothetical protein
MSLYSECVARGIPMQSHCSDLYIPVTPETTALFDQFGKVPTTFVNQVVGGLWYDVPFAFEPWWVVRASGQREIR